MSQSTKASSITIINVCKNGSRKTRPMASVIYNSHMLFQPCTHSALVDPSRIDGDMIHLGKVDDQNIWATAAGDKWLVKEAGDEIGNLYVNNYYLIDFEFDLYRKMLHLWYVMYGMRD